MARRRVGAALHRRRQRRRYPCRPCWPEPRWADSQVLLAQWATPLIVRLNGRLLSVINQACSLSCVAPPGIPGLRRVKKLTDRIKVFGPEAIKLMLRYLLRVLARRSNSGRPGTSRRCNCSRGRPAGWLGRSLEQAMDTAVPGLRVLLLMVASPRGQSPTQQLIVLRLVVRRVSLVTCGGRRATSTCTAVCACHPAHTARTRDR